MIISSQFFCIYGTDNDNPDSSQAKRIVSNPFFRVTIESSEGILAREYQIVKHGFRRNNGTLLFSKA
jgi:hypothetical protein